MPAFPIPIRGASPARCKTALTASGKELFTTGVDGAASRTARMTANATGNWAGYWKPKPARASTSFSGWPARKYGLSKLAHWMTRRGCQRRSRLTRNPSSRAAPVSATTSTPLTIDMTLHHSIAAMLRVATTMRAAEPSAHRSEISLRLKMPKPITRTVPGSAPSWCFSCICITFFIILGQDRQSKPPDPFRRCSCIRPAVVTTAEIAQEESVGGVVAESEAVRGNAVPVRKKTRHCVALALTDHRRAAEEMFDTEFGGH